MPQKKRRTEKLATIIKLAQYAIDEKLSQEIPKVLSFLLDAVHNPGFEPRERIQAAKFLLEYFMPKKQSPLVQINQNTDARRVEIKHISHLGIPTGEAEFTEVVPIPPRRQLIEVEQVDAAEMIPPERGYDEPVPQDQLPPTDVKMVKVADERDEAPLELAPLLRQDPPKWHKRFW